MSEQDNINSVQEMYSAFGRGDVATIVDKCSDDVKWITHLDPAVPWSGDYSGRDNVPRFFQAIFESVDTTSFEPQEWIADGDTVVSIGSYGCRVRATGKEANTRWIFVWKFDDGRVVSYEQFHDENMNAAFR